MFIGFILCLVAPTIYQRSKFFLYKQSFHKINLREKSGLQIHHGHWGIVILFVSTMMFLFWERNLVSTSLFGLGWGFLLDEVAPSVMMPSKDRTFELAIYEKSTKATLLVFISVIVLILVLYLFMGKH